MSADNWARCPRCRARTRAANEQLTAEVEAGYGQVPAETYTALIASLAKLPDPDRLPETFREDYEITGAASGVIKVSYGGSCEDCGLNIQFDHEHVIPGVDE